MSKLSKLVCKLYEENSDSAYLSKTNEQEFLYFYLKDAKNIQVQVSCQASHNPVITFVNTFRDENNEEKEIKNSMSLNSFNDIRSIVESIHGKRERNEALGVMGSAAGEYDKYKHMMEQVLKGVVQNDIEVKEVVHPKHRVKEIEIYEKSLNRTHYIFLEASLNNKPKPSTILGVQEILYRLDTGIAIGYGLDSNNTKRTLNLRIPAFHLHEYPLIKINNFKVSDSENEFLDNIKNSDKFLASKLLYMVLDDELPIHDNVSVKKNKI